MVLCKGDVVLGVVVAGGDFDGEGEFEEGVYDGGDVAALWDGEGAILLDGDMSDNEGF